MAATMTIPMVAWMRYRGHRWQPALEMAASMNLTPQLADALIERLEDEDHVVRVAAAEALQHCTAGDVRNALLAAVGDKSVAVQNAAKSSLRVLDADARGKKQAADSTARSEKQEPALVAEAPV